MKSIYLVLWLAMLTIFSSSSQAEIYKWKDKDGVTRYSDTPPPSNTKLENIGTKKVVKSTGKEPLSPVTNAPVVEQSKQIVLEPPRQDPEETAAEQRQRTAEAEKNNKQEKESQAKLKAENCKAARANFASYAQGGRVYKMNEKGEREYLDDAGLKQGADKARAEVSQYCS
ncbi:MAG: hypothetical protein CTY37_06845 [Methylotenera sp.]|nr:MAG: hypothetical protein CTY37_06845 [Methylotenera sp.]PPD17008.1 MAG: hypothetical protein CTY27_04780 [Methylotenera sp.]PPD56083.1 MAG: hypothetical protein CTY10_06055 [Methylotenera sp.]